MANAGDLVSQQKYLAGRLNHGVHCGSCSVN